VRPGERLAQAGDQAGVAAHDQVGPALGEDRGGEVGRPAVEGVLDRGGGVPHGQPAGDHPVRLAGGGRVATGQHGAGVLGHQGVPPIARDAVRVGGGGGEEQAARDGALEQPCPVGGERVGGLRVQVGGEGGAQHEGRQVRRQRVDHLLDQVPGERHVAVAQLLHGPVVLQHPGADRQPDRHRPAAGDLPQRPRRFRGRPDAERPGGVLDLLGGEGQGAQPHLAEASGGPQPVHRQEGVVPGRHQQPDPGPGGAQQRCEDLACGGERQLVHVVQHQHRTRRHALGRREQAVDVLGG
jgi:hypothetical protein